jgi:hypothetical protein
MPRIEIGVAVFRAQIVMVVVAEARGIPLVVVIRVGLRCGIEASKLEPAAAVPGRKWSCPGTSSGQSSHES